MTTPTNSQLNDDDLELLSAYIDSRLSAGERIALEERLRAEPALRASLDELRATVGLLRDLAPLTPPRSFALDPAAFKPKPSLFGGWLRLGSALTAVVLAFTFLVVFVERGGSGAPASTSAFNAMQQATSAAAEAPQVAMSEATTAPAAGGAAPEALAVPTTGTAADSAATTAPPAAPMAAAAATEAGAPIAAAEQPPTAMVLGPVGSQPSIASSQPESSESSGAENSAGALAQQPTSAPYPQPAAPIATSGNASTDTTDLSSTNPTAPNLRVAASGPPTGLIALGVGALLVLLVGGVVLFARRRRP